MKLTATIYHGPDADLTLPIRILKYEQIRWEVKEDVGAMMRLSCGCTSPVSGWLVWFPLFSEGAHNWKKIYQLLEKRGLLLCI